ncbi:protein Aster-B-like isoform X3 [Bombyx mandarina]|uniref:GRAM domain-containing protein n=2 Tax=Bombyx TaxID=7090 RepID=A0A8R2DNN3_BOMMO|nr:protein Aster-B isoform X3 [Bombyx mori]XP_028037735.1 protein Aster-B-like isoform X3 [Bombyx mandarina]
MIRKSVSCVVYKHATSGSDSSTSTSSSSEICDTPLKRFNRLLRSSVARHWSYFKKDRPNLRTRGRSVSDAAICEIFEHDPELVYLDIPSPPPRRSLQVYGRRPRPSVPRLLITSTGNFASGAAGGGCGAPRSAPATPLQLEPHPRSAKHEKQAVKPLSGSAPSVRVSALGSVSGNDETKDSKQPSKARQKKFQRHFPQVGPEEKVLNYYSCALVGDLLLQGHLYITKNYFAFYSNVFGYVTKLLIPTTSVLRITKEKVARIIPNAVGVCTRDERHVFGSLLSRDSTYKLMMHVWKTARTPELAVPKAQDPRASEVDFEASEYSPEDDSSSAGGDQVDAPAAVRRESETILPTGAAVIQPALLTGSSTPKRRATHCWQFLLVAAVVLLALSALLLSYKLYQSKYAQEEDLTNLTGDELYSELVRWRQRLHGRAADELHSFLSTNLLLLTKVRQSLEALSGVIVDDLPPQDPARVVLDVPNDTAFS